MSPRGHFLDEIVHLLEAELLVGHFTTTETERHLYLHLFAEEVDGMLQLNAKVMRVDVGAKLDLLNLIRVLVLLGFLFLLGLLVTELAVIDQFTNRRIGVRSDFDEIHAAVAPERDGITEGHHPQLTAFGVDDTDLAGTDFAINANERSGRSRTTRSERAIQDTLTS